MSSSWRISECSELTRRLRPFQAERRLVSWSRCRRHNSLNGAKRLNGWNDWNAACQCSPFDLLKAQ